jgi:cobalt-zinc-cadmium efflux system protein
MSKQKSNNSVENIKIALLLNLGFTILEIIGGLWTNSLAILSDALHDLGDSVALIVSWLFEKKAQKSSDAEYTFGYERYSLFAALFSATVLIVGSLIILSKAIPRLIHPEEVNAQGMLLIAILGIVFNGAGFLRLKKGSSLNEKVLSWHFVEDILGWVVILIGSIIMFYWDMPVIDPIMTFGFTLFILFGVSKNLKEALQVLLQGVPKNIDSDKVKKQLLKVKGVRGIHDMHIWSLSGEKGIFTAHIVVEKKLLKSPDTTRKQIKNILVKNNIDHSTIELESKDYCSGVECK